jgi:arylsulfatase A-like enzyme
MSFPGRLLVGLVSVALFATAHSASAKPNLIVILADDMGYGDSSAYGGWIKTPHLDQLAAEGLRFTDFHSSGNVCSPTRAGLMTGRYQQRAGLSGVVLAMQNNPVHFAGLQASEITLPELLQKAGYATALSGKWHLGYFPPYHPLHHGFDEFHGFVSGNVDYHTHKDNQGNDDWWDGLRKTHEPGYTTHLITRHAVDFIRRHRDNPFFLYVAHEAVHDPYQGPNDPPLRGPDSIKERSTDRPIKDVYREMMGELDQGIATIMATLRETGQADNTLVFFFSDNGANANGSNGPLRGFKGSDWEGGHRVPAIAWWPGHIKPGVTDQLTISLDLMPTLLDLADVPAPRNRPLDGVSLKSLMLKGQALKSRELFWNGNAMRDGPWKLMVREGKPQLFNLSEDLAEKRDVSARNPERVQAMLASLERWKNDVATDATPQPQTLEEVE